MYIRMHSLLSLRINHNAVLTAVGYNVLLTPNVGHCSVEDARRGEEGMHVDPFGCNTPSSMLPTVGYEEDARRSSNGVLHVANP